MRGKTMLFNSIEFLIFFPIVVMLYFVIPEKVRYLWLLAASYYFYMGWNPKYALLLLFTTTVTYLSGMLLDVIAHGEMKNEIKERRRKIVVFLSFAINLGVLFFYKYINFTSYLLTNLFARLHITVAVPAFDIVLPVGISFFTFQALSYTVDVYRGETYAERNFLRYALYVSFFPQLVAGPIERSKNLLRQLAVPTKFDFDRARDGLLLMLWGFFLKIVLADRIAVVVDTVYDNYASYPGWYLIVATMLFAVQIYGDFAGYSTIAIGAAEILGINLMENFDAPYTAESVAEFWRRWHISLTSWFRDYVYIPLGGNRKGKFRKNVNRMAVFLLSGLWHGASLHFVVWGGVNGLFQIVGEMLQPVRENVIRFLRLHPDSFGHRLCKVAVTFLLVDFSWIYFRADGLASAHAIIASIVHARNGWILFDGSLYSLGLGEKDFRLMLFCIFLLAVADVAKRFGICIREVIAGQDYWMRWLSFAFAICAILTYGIWGPGYHANNFIYFQF